MKKRSLGVAMAATLSSLALVSPRGGTSAQLVVDEFGVIARRSQRKLCGLVCLACAASLLAVGCSTVPTAIERVPPTGTDDSTATLGPATEELEPDNELSGLIKPSPKGDDQVVCSGTQLPLLALQTLEPMAARPEIETAVNSFLQTGEGEFWPQDGWQIVTISGAEVFVILLQTEADARQDTESRDLEVTFDDRTGDSIRFASHDVELVDGSWRWAGSVSGEDCILESVVPEGFNRVDWKLDPDSSAPTADSTSLRLWATERECASGQPMGDRLLPPEVVETDTAVLIAMVASPAPDDVLLCPDNPPQPVAVDLAAPLGDRELLDGSATAGRLSDHVGEIFGLPSPEE